MFCAANLDEAGGNSLASVEAGLERAARRGEIIQLYAHAPGRTVGLDRLEAVLARADALGLRFVTYAELDSTVPAGGGLALSFDDSDVEAWHATRPLLDRYGARVTFFVSRYYRFTAEQRALLQELAADGHAVEAHGQSHQRAPAYVTEHGLDAYLRDEVVPSLDGLRADGFTPTVFAYPFGARTSEIDAAVLRHVDRVRSVSFSIDGVVADPCPE